MNIFVKFMKIYEIYKQEDYNTKTFLLCRVNIHSKDFTNFLKIAR